MIFCLVVALFMWESFVMGGTGFVGYQAIEEAARCEVEIHTDTPKIRTDTHWQKRPAIGFPEYFVYLPLGFANSRILRNADFSLLLSNHASSVRGEASPGGTLALVHRRGFERNSLRSLERTPRFPYQPYDNRYKSGKQGKYPAKLVLEPMQHGPTSVKQNWRSVHVSEKQKFRKNRCRDPSPSRFGSGAKR
uniref:Uncharacterized protein n=1 Tax=Candidatus Kentrum sp. LFY TaxID=2126342 RepID=A0A450USK1_9GAMM|nr:MAG: hypothetical protein BECKLFY1418A_GA0070994_10517 [Candidatus Kentron sp. LFY]